MCPTNIKQEVDYLGPHEKILEVGGGKHILFQEGVNILFWMTPQEKLSTNFSQYDDP